MRPRRWCFVVVSPSSSTAFGPWLYISGLIDRALQGSLAMKSTHKAKSNNNNEVNYCLDRDKTSAPPYLTCAKAEKKKKAVSDNANKTCYLECSYKEYVSEMSSSFTWIFSILILIINWKPLELKILHSNRSFQIGTTLGRCEQLSPIGFFFKLKSSQEQLNYTLIIGLKLNLWDLT